MLDASESKLVVVDLYLEWFQHFYLLIACHLSFVAIIGVEVVKLYYLP